MGCSYHMATHKSRSILQLLAVITMNSVSADCAVTKVISRRLQQCINCNGQYLEEKQAIVGMLVTSTVIELLKTYFLLCASRQLLKFTVLKLIYWQMEVQEGYTYYTGDAADHVVH